VPTTKAQRAVIEDAGFGLLDQSLKLLQGMDSVRLDLEHQHSTTPEQSPAGPGTEGITGGSPTSGA